MVEIRFRDGKTPIVIDADTTGDALRKAAENGVDLRLISLCAKDLKSDDLSKVNLFYADLFGADLRNVNLKCADLFGADLRKSNLCGANIDFSCWPLWCGSLNVKIDKRIFCQLLYHTLRAGQSVDDHEVKKLFEIPEMVNLANQSHRVDECGKIEVKNGKA